MVRLPEDAAAGEVFNCEDCDPPTSKSPHNSPKRPKAKGKSGPKPKASVKEPKPKATPKKEAKPKKEEKMPTPAGSADKPELHAFKSLVEFLEKAHDWDQEEHQEAEISIDLGDKDDIEGGVNIVYDEMINLENLESLR